MNKRLLTLLAAVVLIGGALFASPVGAAVLEQASSIKRSFYPSHIDANHSDATFQVNQTGSGSIANFKDGGTSEFTIDQSSSTTINPVIVNGSSDAYQVSIVAAPTQSTPPFVVKNSSGTPVAYVDKDGALTASSTTLGTGDVTAAEIANVVRNVNIPLTSFLDCQTDAGALLGFDTTADALADFVNSATDGTGFVIRFDDTGSSEDQSMEICTQLQVPADYASGGAFRIRALKDAHTAATEVLNCAVSVNGAALEAAGTTTTSASATTSYSCTPTIAALAANDSLSFYLSITSDSTMNDLVDIAAVSFFYTATQ